MSVKLYLQLEKNLQDSDQINFWKLILLLLKRHKKTSPLYWNPAQQWFDQTVNQYSTDEIFVKKPRAVSDHFLFCDPQFLFLLFFSRWIFARPYGVL